MPAVALLHVYQDTKAAVLLQRGFTSVITSATFTLPACRDNNFS